MLYWDIQTDNIIYHMSEYVQKFLVMLNISLFRTSVCGEVQ